MSAPRSRMAAFQCSRRSLMSWFTRASRPMLRIFCVVLMLLRGLVGSHLGPPALTPRPISALSQCPSCCSLHITVLPLGPYTMQGSVHNSRDPTGDSLEAVCMRQAGEGLVMYLGGCAGVGRRQRGYESLETCSEVFLAVWQAGSCCHR